MISRINHATSTSRVLPALDRFYLFATSDDGRRRHVHGYLKDNLGEHVSPELELMRQRHSFVADARGKSTNATEYVVFEREQGVQTLFCNHAFEVENLANVVKVSNLFRYILV